MPIQQRQRISKIEVRVWITRCDLNGALISLNRLGQAP